MVAEHDQGLVIEDTPGFGADFAVDPIFIHYLCELNGNGHKIYQGDNENTGPLINISAPTNLPADYTDYHVKFNNVTIDGTGGTKGGVIIGGGAKVLFDTNVIVENCTFNDSQNEGSGGVYVRDNCELTINPGNIIRNCTATSEFGGGAICVKANSVLNIDGAEISGNTSAKYGGGILNVWSSSKINIKDTTFKNNSSAELGGAVYSHSPLTVTGGSFESNTSAYGGAIYANNTATITGTLIKDNTASANGGGIYVGPKAETVTIENTTISGNTAKNNGGGVYMRENTVVSAKNSTIENNSSSYGGGIYNVKGKLTIEGSKVQRNISTKSGGGICLSGGSVDIANNSVVANNQSPFGGGVMAYGGIVNITSSTVEENRAGRGGGIEMSGGTLTVDNASLKGNASNRYAGGIYLYKNAQATIKNSSTVSENSSFFGGGIALNSGSLTVDSSTLEGNIAHAASGYPDTGQGGGILLMAAGDTLNMTSSTVKNNSARYGAGVLLREGSGEFSGVEFNGNDTGQGGAIDPAGRHGGGLYVFEPASAIIKDESKFINNKANWGGAIYTSQHSTEDPVPLSDPIVDTDPYQNLTIDSSTYFEGNIGVNGLYLPPENFEKFTNLGFSDESDVKHDLPRTSLLNNYDVYYQTADKTVTYLANEGVFSDGTDKVIEEEHHAGETITLIAPPTREGYEFVGWKEGDTVYNPGDSFSVTGDHTFTAQWKAEKTVTYLANEGVFDDGSDKKTEKFLVGETITLIDPPTREGYEFVGWKEGDTVYNPGDSFSVTGDHTFTAQWKRKIPVIPIVPIIKPQPVKPVLTGQLLVLDEYDDNDQGDIKPTETHLAYIEGYDDGEVKAQRSLTRAEAAAMVTRLANLDLSDGSKPDYSDVYEGAWYLPYINATLKHNMLDAQDGNIRPDDKITRAEFANMLAQIDKDNSYVSDFADIKGHKYESQINKIYGNKRIIGYEDGSFRPDNLLTRAEAATTLNRMFDRVADEIAVKNLQSQVRDFPDMDKSDWFYWEIVEASNSHHLDRRTGKDEFNRNLEQWIAIFKKPL